MQPIVFPDVEALAVNHLAQRLSERSEPEAQDVYVANRDPQTRRARMVLVRRDGGPRLDVKREAARLTVRIYGRDDDEAGRLATLVRAFLSSAADGSTPVVLTRELSGPQPVPVTAPEYRLMTVEWTVVGQPLV